MSPVGALIAALDRVHRRLLEAEAWDELRALAQMSDDELVRLAERELAGVAA